MDAEDYKAMREASAAHKEKSRMNNTELMEFICAEMELDIDKFSDYHYRIKGDDSKLYIDYYPTSNKARVEGTARYFRVKDIEKALKGHFA